MLIQLFRPINLVVIILTQYLIRHCVILPLYHPAITETAYMELANSSLSHWQFALLVLSTVLIAAGGYLVNDYFDEEVDRINSPKKKTWRNWLTEQQLFTTYMVLNLVGIGLGIYLSFVVGNSILWGIHLLTAVLLWVYSAHLKKIMLIGNVVIATLSAMVVLMVGWFEQPLIQDGFVGFVEICGYWLGKVTIGGEKLATVIWSFIWGYAFFAFLLSLIREIIKDQEDYDGDMKMGFKTLPIQIGIGSSNLVVGVLTALTIYFIFRFQALQFVYQDYLLLIVSLLLVQIPLLYLLFRIRKARRKKTFGQLSLLVKAIMFFGLLYLPYLSTTISALPPETQLIPVDQENISIDEENNVEIDTTYTANDTTLVSPTAIDSIPNDLFDTLPKRPLKAIDPDSMR